MNGNGNGSQKDNNQINQSYSLPKDYYQNNNNSYLNYQSNPNEYIYQDSNNSFNNITFRKQNFNTQNPFGDNKKNSRSDRTPDKKPKRLEDSTWNSPIKKTKRRECTPTSPETQAHSIDIENNTLNTINQTHFNFNNFNGAQNITAINFNDYSTMNDYSNLNCTTTNAVYGTNNKDFSNYSNNCHFHNKKYNLTFTDQKSKFLRKLETQDNDQSHISDNERDIISFFKGNLILYQLGSNNMNIDQQVYEELFKNDEILQKIIYEVILSFFEGFNGRNEAFYKYLVSI